MRISSALPLLFGHLLFSVSANAEQEKETVKHIKKKESRLPITEADRAYYIEKNIAETLDDKFDYFHDLLKGFNASHYSRKDDCMWHNEQLDTKCNEEWTVFAPTDAAFAASEKSLQFDKWELCRKEFDKHGADFVHYHITEGSIKASRLRNGGKIRTIYDGRNILSQKDSFGNLTLVSPGSTASITEPDIETLNGLIQGIDNPLLPMFASIGVYEGLDKMGGFSKFLEALTDTGVGATLNGTGPYTVFAPTNKAFKRSAGYFAKLSAEDQMKVIQYHIIEDKCVYETEIGDGYEFSLEGSTLDFANTGYGTIVIDGQASIIESDLMVCNGVIHVVDRLLIPESLFGPSIFGYIQAKPSFSILEGLLSRVNLADTFTDAGLYTFFAPSNSAFAKSDLDFDTMSDAEVLAILEYHYIRNSAIEAADLDGLHRMASTGRIVVNNGVINENSRTPARIIDSDIMKHNGVIHVINRVLDRFTVVDVLESLGLDKMVETIEMAGLTSRFSDPDPSIPITLLAPTNQAFKYLGDLSTLSSLELQDLVLNHQIDTDTFDGIVGTDLNGIATYAQITNAKVIARFYLPTYAGNLLEVEQHSRTNSTGVATQRIFVLTESETVAARFKEDEVDVYASNAIIHVVNRVLIEDVLKTAIGHKIAIEHAGN